MQFDNLMDIFFDNLKKLFYPEEWIGLDLSLSKTEMFTLLLVDRHKEIIMSQIADYINIPMSTATGIVDRLVKKGYLKRDRSDYDRRIVVLQLTEDGQHLLDNFKVSVNKYIDIINQGLTEEEREFLFKIMLKAVKLVSQSNASELQETEVKKIKKINIE
ncbi:MAG: hypothetical protein APF76_16530 [Desulfitibacter sp. BRH_c19]|nr:MAG: hypothetical protein APF76_16530 [Desulfitibacter sp. BRH_c19]